ncbi:MAG TPA: metal ABC transporter permease [Tepidisphaeraceae bacterium]|nr:metal ABC transporter permease [Tepidisphaeraceae bacterium]
MAGIPADSSIWPELLRAGLASASVGVAGAVLSVFVVLRRWAYLGDGIAHAGFGGIGTAVLLTIAFPALNNGTAIFLIGAGFAIATALAVASISRRRAVSGDAAIGIFVAATLAWGFIAFGIHAHLGRGGPSSWELYLLGNASSVSNADAMLAVGFSAAVVLTVLALQKQIVLYCFDPVLAQVTGVPTGFVHYLLILLVAVVIIMGMQLSGNLLVPALLVLPGAAGLRVSRRLRIVMTVAVIASVVATLAGLAISRRWEFIAPGPAIVGVLFLEFLAAHFAAGRGGAEQD